MLSYREGIISIIKDEIKALQLCRSEYEENYIKSHLFRLMKAACQVDIVIDYKALVPVHGWHPSLKLIK
jgi:hypothetical protein